MTAQELIDSISRSHAAHGTAIRCPECNAGIGKWCVGNERKAGPTDLHPSCQKRLVWASHQ